MLELSENFVVADLTGGDWLDDARSERNRLTKLAIECEDALTGVDRAGREAEQCGHEVDLVVSLVSAGEPVLEALESAIGGYRRLCVALADFVSVAEVIHRDRFGAESGSLGEWRDSGRVVLDVIEFTGRELNGVGEVSKRWFEVCDRCEDDVFELTEGGRTRDRVLGRLVQAVGEARSCVRSLIEREDELTDVLADRLTTIKGLVTGEVRFTRD